jgi:hypothetical protein
MALAFDRQKHFIHMLLVAKPRTPTTELIRILLAKFATPFPHRFIGHDHSAFQQQFFHITKAEAEPKIQPHSVADDLHRKAMVLVFRKARQCVHALITSHEAPAAQASQEVDNAHGSKKKPNHPMRE